MLKVRKNFKENEPKIQEAKKAIAQSVGVDSFEIEVNWNTFADKENGVSNDNMQWIGTFVGDRYVKALNYSSKNEQGEEVQIKDGIIYFNTNPDSVAMGVDYADRMIFRELDRGSGNVIEIQKGLEKLKSKAEVYQSCQRSYKRFCI